MNVGAQMDTNMRVVPSQCAVVGKLLVTSLTMGVEMQRVAVQMFHLRLCFQHSMQDYYYQEVDFLNARHLSLFVP